MTRHRTLDRTLRVAVCLGAILAAGCGGGGDEAPPPPELLQITAGNQVAVARATAMSFGSLDSARDLPTASSSSAAHASAVSGSTKHALGKAVAAARATSAKVMPLGIFSYTEPCSVSGSITLTLDDRDNNTNPSAGDVLTMAFNDCRDSASSLVKGTLTVNVASYADPLLSGLFSFGQLTLVDGDSTIAMNGQANFVYTESRDPAGTSTTRITMKVAAAGLVNSISIPNYKDTFTYDPDLSAVWTDVTPSAAPGYSTSVLSGKVHIASLGGKVIVNTDPPIHDVWAEDYPDSGKLLITGYQSKLQLTVLNTTTTRLELDANNDGTFESTRDMPWSELLPW